MSRDTSAMKRRFSATQDQFYEYRCQQGSSQRPPRFNAVQDVLFRSYRTWPSPTYRLPRSVELRTRDHPPPPVHFSSIFRPPSLPRTVQAAVPPFAPLAPCFHLESTIGAANGYYASVRGIPVRQTEAVASPLGSSGPSFSVVTYNVLAQDLIHKNPNLYTHCPESLLDWEYRKHNLMRELVESDAEVICLQEVQEEHFFSWYQPQLAERGYEGVYQKRTGKHLDGCAMFYKSSVLEAMEVRAITYQRNCTPLNKDNVALILRLRWKRLSPKSQRRDQAPPISESHTFCVATTHLLFNPRAGEIKLAQMVCLLAELHSAAAEGSGDQTCPVVVCGDMNSIPTSPLISFLRDGRLDYQSLSAWDIAGYYKKKGRQRRRIPVPLLPSHLGIGSNCKYSLASVGSSDVAGLVGPIGSSVGGSDIAGLGGQTGSAGSTAGCFATPPLGHLPPSSPQQLGTPPQTSASSSPSACSVDGSSPESMLGGSNNEDGPPGITSSSGVLSHSFNFCSAYGHTPYNHGTATTYHQAAFETVDYILFGPVCGVGGGGRARGLHLLSRKAIPHHATLKGLGPQPHEFLSSDHLLLQATFQMVC